MTKDNNADADGIEHIEWRQKRPVKIQAGPQSCFCPSLGSQSCSPSNRLQPDHCCCSQCHHHIVITSSSYCHHHIVINHNFHIYTHQIKSYCHHHHNIVSSFFTQTTMLISFLPIPHQQIIIIINNTTSDTSSFEWRPLSGILSSSSPSSPLSPPHWSEHDDDPPLPPFWSTATTTDQILDNLNNSNLLWKYHTHWFPESFVCAFLWTFPIKHFLCCHFALWTFCFFRKDYLCSHFAFLFSTKAVIPSFLSFVPNDACKKAHFKI